jgi:uncharacterized protein YndB with AHSA1/START domain
MPDIVHHVKIRVSPERVYKAVTTTEDARNWWTRDAVLDSKIGGGGEFGFHGRRVVTKLRVNELEPPVRVAWKIISSNAPGGWNGTTITFDLRADGNETVVSFAHRGFETANEDYERVTAGWEFYLVSLQRYLETGTGSPHADLASQPLPGPTEAAQSSR